MSMTAVWAVHDEQAFPLPALVEARSRRLRVLVKIALIPNDSASWNI